MKITISGLVLILCALCSSSDARGSSLCTAVADNLVSNCGFETGDFTSWEISGNKSNPLSTYYGVDALDANSGSFGAYMSQDFIDGGIPALILSQTLTTTAGEMYSFNFFLKQDSTPTTGYAHTFTASWGGTTVLDLTPTIAAPGRVGAYTEYSFMEMATGPTTVLQFDFENDNQYWSFDDVSAAAAPMTTPTTAPEPGSLLLVGTGLLGLAATTRRRFCRLYMSAVE
jgi:PEP-CTERM motif